MSGYCSKCGETGSCDCPTNKPAGRVDSLRECPMCGDVDATPFKPQNAWHVRCRVCGTCTGWRDTKKQAIEAWNTRSTALLDSPEMVEVVALAIENSNRYTPITIEDFRHCLTTQHQARISCEQSQCNAKAALTAIIERLK